MAATPAHPLADPEPWDAVSDAYTREHVPMFETFARAALAQGGLGPAARIADIATGPGTLALLAARQGYHVTALDFSGAMLEQLRLRAQSMNINGQLELRQGDGQHLPFADGAFDGVFSMFGLIFFPDRAAGFRELRRVLMPGCRAVVSSWAPQQGPFGTVMELVRAAVPGNVAATPPPTLGHAEDYEREMRAAGFSRVQVEYVPFERRFATLQDYWACVECSNPGALQTRRKVGEEAWHAISETVLGQLRGQWGSGGVNLPVKALLGVGVA